MSIRNSSQIYEFIDKSNELKVHNYLRRSLRLNPGHTEARFEYALSLYYVEEYQKSIKEFNMLEMSYPRNDRVYNNRGMVHMELKDYSAAIRDYKRAIDLNPNTFRAYRNLGLLYKDIFFQMDSAIIYFEKASHIAPENYEVQFSLATALQLAKRYEESLAQSKIVEQLDNSRPGLYTTRGLTKYYLEDYHGAVNDFLKSISMQMPALYEEHTNALRYTYNNLANCYLKMGELSNACIYWQKAIDAGYEYRQEWLVQYGIENPIKLVKSHCKDN